MTTLDAQLAAAAGRRWWNRWTVVLAVALLLVGGFATGIEVQKAYGEQPTGGGGFRGQGGFTPPTAFPGGGAARGGTGNSGSGSGETTTGTVKLVDGTTVYVETAAGEVVTVRTDGATTVAIPGKLKDLKAGDKVSVQGGADGSTAATSVTRSK
ncbi:hypothetical protein Ais01nite_13970 [Asanoa ishikariensis]|uniref:DUF5666 domain-containing protein n=1 Tax=Asanoa ishikariensis TaxID=137265 RepID=A0A1H3UL99_9ACTN|nr:hypothetical protein [Asanoa ishikariensis]GIF63362.1 hypothetical protein Ais01nite_13970 [Asanoa ishikariensis]SDZ62489.1 hypothetical protein SAMN05421684_7476 [Asanoa ishikariensis]